MDWFFSGLLIAVSAGITAFTGYVLWRLFHAEPGPGEGSGLGGVAVLGGGSGGSDDADGRDE